MKTYFLKFVSVFFCIVMLNSCSSNDEEAVPVAPVDMSNSVSYKGMFVSSAHPTSGEVQINKEKTMLNFVNFMSDSGPDLDIYLASDLSNIKSNFLNLGDIKGLKGNYGYSLPANTDYSKYKYVVVWCVDFDVNFGYATLTKQ
jgi:Electron transfer DM13